MAFKNSLQKCVETTNSIGIISKSGRYGGTFEFIDIVFEFALKPKELQLNNVAIPQMKSLIVNSSINKFK